METKVCKKCNMLKPISAFRAKKDKDKVYIMGKCRDCINEEKREAYKNNEQIRTKAKERARKYEKAHQDEIREKRREYKKEYNKQYHEEHKEYFQNYKKTEKYKKQQKEYKNEVLEIDGEEIKRKTVQRRKYRKEHREEYLLSKRKVDKRYRDTHKEQIKQWKKDNIELIRRERREYHKKRAASDPLYKFEHQIRGAIRASFKRKKYKKNDHTYEIIGLPFDEFYEYLLQTFKDNYGYEWDGVEPVHIDHIIPLTVANSEEEIIKLCYYTNLQLLKPHDNLEKHDKLDWNKENTKKAKK